MPSFMDFFFGQKDKAKKFSNFTPDQMNLFQQFMQGLSGQGGQFGDMFGQFNPDQASNTFQQGVANPAMRNFNQRVVPGIMQSFADQGASSGLNNSLATAGRDLQENLSSQLSNFIYQSQLQHNQNRLQGLNTGLNTRQFSPYVQQGYKGAIPSLLESFSQGAGTAFGSSMF